MDDLISRQALCEYALNQKDKSVTPNDIMRFPSAQPDLDEWCTDCKEYDKEKHHCPRYNRVIREALKDAELEPCGEMVSREVLVKFFDDWMSALDINCHHQSVADLMIIKGDIKNLPSAQPEIIRCKDCKF